MTDIETLLRETFVAHESLADRSVTPVRPAARNHAPLLAVAAVAVIALVAAGAVLLVNREPDPGPHNYAPATTKATPPDLRNLGRSRAESQAQLLLTEAAKKVFRFPGGAESIDASAVSELANLTTYAVDSFHTVVRSTYWTTTVRDPSGVELWFAQHPLDGFAVARGPRYVDTSDTPRQELVIRQDRHGGPVDTPRRERPPELLFQALPHGDGVAFRVTVVLHY